MYLSQWWYCWVRCVVVVGLLFSFCTECCGSLLSLLGQDTELNCAGLNCGITLVLGVWILPVTLSALTLLLLLANINTVQVVGSMLFPFTFGCGLDHATSQCRWSCAQRTTSTHCTQMFTVTPPSLYNRRNDYGNPWLPTAGTTKTARVHATCTHKQREYRHTTDSCCYPTKRHPVKSILFTWKP